MHFINCSCKFEKKNKKNKKIVRNFLAKFEYRVSSFEFEYRVSSSSIEYARYSNSTRYSRVLIPNYSILDSIEYFCTRSPLPVILIYKTEIVTYEIGSSQDFSDMF